MGRGNSTGTPIILNNGKPLEITFHAKKRAYQRLNTKIDYSIEQWLIKTFSDSTQYITYKIRNLVEFRLINYGKKTYVGVVNIEDNKLITIYEKTIEKKELKLGTYAVFKRLQNEIKELKTKNEKLEIALYNKKLKDQEDEIKAIENKISDILEKIVS